MKSSMGIYRNEKDLKEALAKLDELDTNVGDHYYDHVIYLNNT